MPPGIIALLLISATPVLPTSSAPVRLEMTNCDDLDPAVVQRVLTMELGASLAANKGAITTSKVDCQPTAMDVTIDDPVTGKSTSRVLDLADQPKNVHSRLLGMAISEAVLARWSELASTPRSEPPPTAPKAQPTAQRKEADPAINSALPEVRNSPADRYQWTGGLAARWFASGLVVGGLSAGAARWMHSYPHMGLALDLGGDYGERTVADVGRASATTLSLASRLLVRTRLSHFDAVAGAGWRVALSRLAGEPTDTLRVGRTTTAGWTGPFLAAGISMDVSRTLFLRLGLECGRALVPARGTVNEKRLIALDGTWFGGEISLGMKPQ